MQNPDSSEARSGPVDTGTLVVLGTGGTIAGTAASADDATGYTAAQVGVEQLLRTVPELRGRPLESEQIAQLDSKDMTEAVWHRLALRVAHHLARRDVAGVLITHGTDTAEETAWLLQRLLAPAKPVMIVTAMLPASHRDADGPRNLADAASVARTPGACGVLLCAAGTVWRGDEVRKAHSRGIDAFDAGGAAPLGRLVAGSLVRERDWPQGAAMGLTNWPAPPWPWVEVVTSHAGATRQAVDAWVAAGVRGLVVAGTGSGTVHAELEAALDDAVKAGVRVCRASRVARGGAIDRATDHFPAAGTLTPAQARIELLLRLLSGQ